MFIFPHFFLLLLLCFGWKMNIRSSQFFVLVSNNTHSSHSKHAWLWPFGSHASFSLCIRIIFSSYDSCVFILFLFIFFCFHFRRLHTILYLGWSAIRIIKWYFVCTFLQFIWSTNVFFLSISNMHFTVPLCLLFVKRVSTAFRTMHTPVYSNRCLLLHLTPNIMPSRCHWPKIEELSP